MARYISHTPFTPFPCIPGCHVPWRPLKNESVRVETCGRVLCDAFGRALRPRRTGCHTKRANIHDKGPRIIKVLEACETSGEVTENQGVLSWVRWWLCCKRSPAPSLVRPHPRASVSLHRAHRWQRGGELTCNRCGEVPLLRLYPWRSLNTCSLDTRSH